jgi:hypothetical protein
MASRASRTSMSIMAEEDDKIVTMSYNVCFGCMYSDANSSKDVTSVELSKHCKDLAEKENPKKNICLENIQTVFNVTAYNQFGSFDLVGIQEATNWNEIIKAHSLKNLSFIHHKSKFEDMVSLYNSKKFKLDAFIIGDIDGKGRPYQILFLTHKLSNIKYIFINIHNSHINDPPLLANALSSNKNAFVIDNDKKSFDNCQQIPPRDYSDYSSIISQNEYNIIFMGDTNFHNAHNIWKMSKQFQPLINMGINVSVSNKTNPEKPPPNTCCVGSRNLRSHVKEDSRYGDYILISEKLSYIVNNVIPSFNPDAKTFPTSDHLPIVSVIKLPSFQRQEQEQEFRIEHDIILRFESTSKNLPEGMTASKKNIFIYPNGKQTQKGYVFVQDKNDSNIIGYVNNSYLEKKDDDWKLQNQYRTRILRLQDDPSDPARNVKLSHKGTMHQFQGIMIENTNTLIFPNGEVTKNGLVIVQDKDDNNIIGYIKKEDLIPISGKSGKSSKSSKSLMTGGSIRQKKNYKKSKKNNYNKKNNNKNNNKSNNKKIKSKKK